jgi:hypothetical protein
MSTTRRTFMTGLSFVLSFVRIPSVSAWGAMNMPEDDYVYEPPIEYLEVGECGDMLGGPASEPGWYLHPACMIGCCASEGPFPSKRTALEADRRRWAEVAKSSRGQNDANDEQPEDLLF